MRAAFSLLELAVVVAVIGVGAALALPRYADAVARYRCDAAGARVAADLNGARIEALTASRARAVQFVLAEHAYTVRDPADGLGAGTRVVLRDEPYQATLVRALFGASADVTFGFDGAPSAGGIVMVRVGRFYRSVDLDGASGAATSRRSTPAEIVAAGP